MAGISPWRVPIFGREFDSHKVVMAWFGIVGSFIGYKMLKPKNYSVGDHVKSLPQEQQEKLEKANFKP